MSEPALQPIWEVPEVQHKVKEVQKYIARMVRDRNLFAWRTFVHDLQIDIELEIYKYEGPHRAGVPGYEKEQGIGAYCNMAVQGALNYAFMYSAQKRRLNFESSSFEALAETEGAPDRTPPAKEDGFQRAELFIYIQQEFGEEIKSLIERIFNGEQLSRAELNRLKKEPYLREALRGECDGY